MKKFACGLFLSLCIMGIPMMALADAPVSYNWTTAPGGALNASTVDLDAWMEAMSEYVYDNDVPYSFMDPNGEPDGINERGYAVDWPPPWDRGDPDPADPWPATVVPNDGNGNGIPDILEFAVIKEICNNESTYPTLHAQVHESFKKNFTYFGGNLGLAGNMVPPLKYILAAYAMLGDGSYQRFRYPEGPCPTACTEYGYGWTGSWGVAAEMIYAMNDVFANGWRPAGTSGCTSCNGAPNDTLCDRLEDLLSACGDVDGDGVTNIGEFYGQGGVAGVYSATVRAAYVAAVLDPLVTADGGDPDEVCVEGPPGPGLTWNVNLFYNPDNHYVYMQGMDAPWFVNQSWAEHFTLGEGKEAVPGNLATVDSADLTTWINTTFIVPYGDKVWIGATDKDVEGAWRWIATGVQFWSGRGSGAGGVPVGDEYSNWAGTGEPNDSGGEDAAEVYPGGAWNDSDWSDSNLGVIEFSNGGEGFPDDNGNGYPDFWETYVEAPGGPSADFEADVVSGMQPLDVTFTDLSDGNGETITSWLWDFGDGETSTEQGPIIHTYVDASTYTVSLTVETVSGSATKTRTAYITVTERLYRASIDAAGGAWLEEGDLLSLTAVVTGGTPPIEYRWQKNGEDIVPPATDATYEKVAAVADSGEYTCVVNDDSKAETLAGPYIVTVFPEGSLPVAGIVGLALLAGAAILGARSAFRKK